MQMYSVVVPVFIFFRFLHATSQLEQEHPDPYSNISVPPKVWEKVEAHAAEEILSPTSLSVNASFQGKNNFIRKKREIRDGRRRYQDGRQPTRGGGPRNRTSQKKESTPAEKLRKMNDRLFRRVASYKVPKGYVLPFCFKDTRLSDEIEDISGICDRMGVDWPCVFAEMAGGDNGFSIKSLASKFDEVEDESLHRGLQSAIVACDEYWQEYKHEERRRLLLHELETEVLSKTWVERGEHIGEPYKPKRRAEDFKNLTDPAAIRRALLDAGYADHSMDLTSNEGNDSLIFTSRIHRRNLRSSNISENAITKRERVPGYGVQIKFGGCLSKRYSVHPWKSRSRRGGDCVDSSVVVEGEPLGSRDDLIQDSSNIKSEVLCSASNERCRRDDKMLDRVKQEREKKRQQVLKRKELKEEAQRRIEELMKKEGGGGKELEDMLETSKEGPEIESKLGQHLEREERIEEDLRSQVSSCITEEATKACEPKVMQKLSSLFP